jgi:hypothetical protein
MKKLIIALIASAGAIGAVHAQTPTPYIGVGVVAADHNYKISGGTVSNEDGYKAGAKIFGGVDFDKTWGLEAGYTKFGSADANYSIAGVPGSLTAKGNSLYLAGKATMPINEQFSMFAKLGVARNKTEVTSTLAALRRDDSKTEGYGALGAQFQLTKEVALTAEYERYGKKRDIGTKADAFTVAAKYSF